MDKNTMSILSGIAEGADKAVSNIMDVQYKKAQIQRLKEKDKINRRYREAATAKMEAELDDVLLQNQQNKMIHDKAIDRMKGAAFTLDAIRKSKYSPSSGGVTANAISRTPNQMTPTRANNIGNFSNFQKGAAPVSYYDAIQEQLPVNSSTRIGRTTIKARGHVDPKEAILRKMSEGKDLTEGEQRIYDETIRRKDALDKGPSYTEQYRSDLQLATDRLRDGEKVDTIIGEMRRKYPSNFSYNTEFNLKQVARDAQIELRGLKNQAVQELKRAGYPVTENNIKAAMKQLRGQ